jgi:hypothetical protein
MLIGFVDNIILMFRVWKTHHGAKFSHPPDQKTIFLSVAFLWRVSVKDALSEIRKLLALVLELISF